MKLKKKMKPALITSILLLLSSSQLIPTTYAFAPKSIDCYHSSLLKPNHAGLITTASIIGGKTVAKSKTRLFDGVFIAVPENFFTITGIALGITYSLTRTINRVALENAAWENRLEEARQRKLDGDDGVNLYTELELRRQDAELSKSAYGAEAMEDRRTGRSGGRVKTRREASRSARSGDRMYGMTDEQIKDFEEEYGVKYDPYYDEPYTEDELPDDMKFSTDRSYGDRRYKNGEVFYQDEENKKLYWRQGGKPRLKKFWDMV